MSVMKVLHHPNPILKMCAEPIDPASEPDIHGLVRSMIETMNVENGVGLAAPQVGVSKGLIVFATKDEILALCNPVIVAESKETAVGTEGCLSVPGIDVPVERSLHIVCRGQTIDGEDVTIEAYDFLARVIQHETDHLDGKLILDRAPESMRKQLIRAYNEANGL